MSHLIVKGAVAINAVVWDGVAPIEIPDGCAIVEQPANVGIGWRLVNGAWEPPAPPPPKPVTVVSMRQARLALLQDGLLANVEAAIAASDEATKIEWEYAQEVKRAHPLVAQIAIVLGLDDAALDSLFLRASSL